MSSASSRPSTTGCQDAAVRGANESTEGADGQSSGSASAAPPWGIPAETTVADEPATVGATVVFQEGTSRERSVAAEAPSLPEAGAVGNTVGAELALRLIGSAPTAVGTSPRACRAAGEAAAADDAPQEELARSPSDASSAAGGATLCAGRSVGGIGTEARSWKYSA